MTATKPKRGRGRPSLTGETGERYQVTIPPSIADRLRVLGGGSLSAGIIKSAKRCARRSSDEPAERNEKYYAQTHNG